MKIFIGLSVFSVISFRLCSCQTGETNLNPRDNLDTSISVPFYQGTDTDLTESKTRYCQPGYECVVYYLCKDNLIVKDGTGLIDVRMSESNDGCNESLYVCCAHGNLTYTYNPVDRVTPPPPPQPPIPSPPIITGCGYRNINGVGVRITGGENEAQFGEFPWMVAVLRKDVNTTGTYLFYKCGGSLIHPSVVLTAAHCVSGLSSNILKIRGGEWDTRTNSEPLPFQDSDVAQVIIHENFKKTSLHNDIALLFLSTPLNITGNVNPICLPPTGESFNNQRCFATGWGKDKFLNNSYHQVILKKIELPIVSHDNCENNLRQTRLGKYFQLDESFLCAGGEEGKDTCTGDGGSPLICAIDDVSNQYYQAGIVAWGIGCGDANVPGVYVKVEKFRTWIDQLMASKGLDGISYIPR